VRSNSAFIPPTTVIFPLLRWLAVRALRKGKILRELG
jgi:hypothetical protein